MKTEFITNLLRSAGVQDDKLTETVNAIFVENGKDIAKFQTSENSIS